MTPTDAEPPPDEPAALFRRTGASTYVPTGHARGAWDRGLMHGAAIAALIAGRLHGPEGWTLARFTIEILAPVPMAPCELRLTPPGGGRRAQRGGAELVSGEKLVATATSVLVRQGSVEPPDRQEPSPFDREVPPLAEPDRGVADVVGWDSFDSRSIAMAWQKVPGDHRSHQWISLAVPVVEGEPIQGIELAAVAADYAQTAVARVLPFAEWSFRNTEITVHLARTPAGSWVGVRSDAVIGDGGTGFNDGALFDERGALGRSAASLVVERR